MPDFIEWQLVRFKVNHPGMGANIGDRVRVPKDWAEQAIQSGIDEDAEPAPSNPAPAK